MVICTVAACGSRSFTVCNTWLHLCESTGPSNECVCVALLAFVHANCEVGNADILALRESSYNRLFVTDIMLNGLQVFDTTGWALPCKSLVPAVDAQRLP